MTAIIVFDLDGTLADGTHREHHIKDKEPKDKDWASYFDAAGGDSPIAPIVLLYQSLHSQYEGLRIEIWTGRVERTRSVTETWIDQHLGLQPDKLQMRQDSDRTNDHELKRSWLRGAQAAGDQVLMVFEDRTRVVEMWREEGIICAQVAKGDF